MKKTAKILAIIVAFALIGGILYVGNGFVGNPISKMLATNTAEKHINQHYAGSDYIVEKVNYNFKDDRYYAKISSSSSVDSYFSLSISLTGKLCWDSYENMVTSGRNTHHRVDNEYKKMAEFVFDKDNFPYISYSSYGSIREKFSVEQGGITKDFGLDAKSLVIDKPYDLRKLGAKYGELTFYAEDETVSAKRAGEILLDITKILDEKNVPFYAITFVLEKPKINDTPNPNKT